MNWMPNSFGGNTQFDIALVVQIVTALTALVAVVVGPMIALIVSRRQIANQSALSYAQSIAPMRQAWINELRRRVSDLMSETASFNIYKQHHPVTAEELYEWSKTMFSGLHQVILMLNLQEADHVKFINDLRDWCVMEHGAEANEDVDERATRSDLLNQCSAILKREWQVVKDGG